VKIRLIHGIHEKEGATNMSALLPHIKRACPDSDVTLFEYGFLGFWEARWRNTKIAMRLARFSNTDERRMPEVWITHSNGAAVAYLAVEKYGATPDMIININPALDRWRAARVPFVEVIHSGGDRWVYLSRWLWWNIWGDQGKVGYGGARRSIVNHDAGKMRAPLGYQQHSELFDPTRIEPWAQAIARRIEIRLNTSESRSG
jgi:hypothetical protein